ncbi:MAG: Pseudouridine-5'-phosphate glycosidase [Spirochaetes bacterium ADurb.Bin110]|jgi:pseudouridine-5'-phosphate glycosidase|nr:MAG: Pseudouridine-5'-phosphate glycosidase [Spirochaetes bacterium ADurb.Bin110]HNV37478.1 pseudouridine-5'-phosphate glycosidase [Rectinema sp.]
MNKYLDISEEVTDAISVGIPVVALESTIITHGMPWPQNLETALEVENAVKEEGAIPATIAIINGRLKVGLTHEELVLLANGSLKPIKASRRDFPGLIAFGGNGATTVAGTMIIAEMAAIHVFATGGIGGVHRGAEKSWDVSADLEELAHTDVAVVCAGAKAILDLPKTMEYLETKGVPVIGYRTSELPAFYTQHSGVKLSLRADTPQEIAMILRAKWESGLKGGVVIANPIPSQYAMSETTIEAAIQKAIEEAEHKGLKGAEVTPYLLSRVADLTGGDSLESNIALVLNNARLAARIAKE